MARLLFAALALGQCATALLDGVVNVVRIQEDTLLAGNNLNVKVVKEVVVAADANDPEISACATADAVLASCVSSGLLQTTAPTASAKACLCCHSGIEVVDKYSSCATYIAKSFPTQSAAYSTVSLLYNICATGTCAAKATPTTSRTTTAPSSRVTAPVGCTSFISIYSSCSDKLPGFKTIALSSIASCFCYDKSGLYNTRFDNYASSCAPFAKTAVPEDYSVISALATFCQEFPPQTTGGRGSATGNAGGLGGFGLGSTASTSTSASATTTVTVRSSQGLAAPAAVPGVVAWMANLLTFVLSFFVLI